jgi:hypothetical protein
MSYIRYSDKIGRRKSRFYIFDYSDKEGMGFGIRDDKDTYESVGGKLHVLKKSEVKVLYKFFHYWLFEREKVDKQFDEFVKTQERQSSKNSGTINPDVEKYE